MIYPGRKALHIFDIDNEKWLLESETLGYEDIYLKVQDYIKNERKSETIEK